MILLRRAKRTETVFGVSPKFEAPQGKYDWLNRYIFVGVGEKVPHANAIHYYKML